MSGKLIYADHAATTRLSAAAFEAMRPYLLDDFANTSQPYSAARRGRKALAEARETIAGAIGADADEIYFTSGGTESDNWALKGTMLAAGLQGRLVTSAIEHHAILRSAAALARLGCDVREVPVDPTGTVRVEDLRVACDDRTRLVSVMLSNNEVGSIQPIAQLAEVAHACGAVFHTDAVQAVGHIPVDVDELGADLLSASAHKFNGPKGIGFLYVRKGTSILSHQDGGAQERGLRAGTENVAAIVGMAAALKENVACLAESRSHLLALESRLCTRLLDAQVTFRRNGSENHVPGNLSLSFPGFQGEALLHRLDLKGICVSTGSACDSRNTQISHVLRAMKVPTDCALGTIRISLGRENTEEDIDSIAAALMKILKILSPELIKACLGE